jgi:uncharacterized protein (DUF2336 family)
MDTDEAKRVRQGASKTTSPEILRSLATDPSVTVRASLALNPALPEQVIAILEGDTDARVRAILGRKLAPLTATIPDETRQRVQKDAVASLTAMVAEAALRVRVSIAEAVRDMPAGPRDIVLRLAQDPAVMVCEPVILFSPMLPGRSGGADCIRPAVLDDPCRGQPAADRPGRFRCHRGSRGPRGDQGAVVQSNRTDPGSDA